MKYPVHFINEKRTFMAEAGTTVLEAEIAAGIVPDAPCGGKGTCGKCKVVLNGREALACQSRISRESTVVTFSDQNQNYQILRTGLGRAVDCVPGPLPGNVKTPLLAAVDLGSTSVVAYLIGGVSGKVLGSKSIMNPQRQFGADVVMRCSYAMEHGMDTLSSCIREAINRLLHDIAFDCGLSAKDIVRIVMAGNSCMHHLFLGIPVNTLALAPYEPLIKDAVTKKASDFGIHVCPDAQLHWLPNIGGFVGADTAACILTAEYDRKEEMTLLIDIGTNGEMVLGNKDGYSVCSTAAGPAFEGARITCGMRGSTGAIDRVHLENGKPVYHVIGDCPPRGICGSGLLDAVYCLLQTGQIDKSGRMKDIYRFTPDVYLTPKDVRELQLAKAAIAAGVQLLCRHRNIELSDIQELLLAGAFGSFLDPVSACGIGLLPGLLIDRIRPIGNAAGQGAQIAALNVMEFERSRELAAKADFLELAMSPDFQDVYVDELSFDEEDFYGI